MGRNWGIEARKRGPWREESRLGGGSSEIVYGCFTSLLVRILDFQEWMGPYMIIEVVWVSWRLVKLSLKSAITAWWLEQNVCAAEDLILDTLAWFKKVSQRRASRIRRNRGEGEVTNLGTHKFFSIQVYISISKRCKPCRRFVVSICTLLGAAIPVLLERGYVISHRAVSVSF